MKEIELPSGKYLLVETPEIIEDVAIINDGRSISWFCTDMAHGNFSDSFALPVGKLSIVGKASNITKSDWISIIEKENDGSGSLRCWWYKIYTSKHIMTKCPKESGLSLIKYHFMEPETTLILRFNAQ